MSVFKFKKFTLTHHPEVFKFGTDAALLATSIPLNNPKNILEIGTGTGVISLILGQRFPNTPITGIDISAAAIQCANENLHHYSLAHQINFQLVSLQNFVPSTPFEVIVSNPPFFENSTKSTSLKLARHTDSLSLNDFLKYAAPLLSPTGQIFLIYPSRYFTQLQEIGIQNGLFISRVTFFKDRPTADSKRILVTFSKQKRTPVYTTQIVKGNHFGYSEQVYRWFTPFYLQF